MGPARPASAAPPHQFHHTRSYSQPNRENHRYAFLPHPPRLPSPITTALAQNDADTPPNFITDSSSVLFVRLDLAKLDLEQIDALLKTRLDQPELDRHSRKALDRATRGITATLAELKRRGVQDLYLIGSLEFLDFHLDPLLQSPQDFVYVIVPHTTSLDTAAIAKAFGTKLAERPDTANLSPRDDRARRWIAIECDSGNQQPQRWFTVIGPQRLLARVVIDRAQPRRKSLPH